MHHIHICAVLLPCRVMCMKAVTFAGPRGASLSARIQSLRPCTSGGAGAGARHFQTHASVCCHQGEEGGVLVNTERVVCPSGGGQREENEDKDFSGFFTPCSPPSLYPESSTVLAPELTHAACMGAPVGVLWVLLWVSCGYLWMSCGCLWVSCECPVGAPVVCLVSACCVHLCGFSVSPVTLCAGRWSHAASTSHIQPFLIFTPIVFLRDHRI